MTENVVLVGAPGHLNVIYILSLIWSTYNKVQSPNLSQDDQDLDVWPDELSNKAGRALLRNRNKNPRISLTQTLGDLVAKTYLTHLGCESTEKKAHDTSLNFVRCHD